MSKFVRQKRWYENTVFYQLHIRAFLDTNNDGHGDFLGIIQKLDYIKSLGVDCIWLMPMYPSPLVDDGYDVSDYTDVNKDFGDLPTLKKLITEAHKRGMYVIGDFVVNHTSDEHKWFKESSSSKDSPYRDYYVWSDTGTEYKDVKVIFSDTETSNWKLDKKTNQYYWHRFYSRQPDLNYDNKAVWEEMFKITRFWLDLGLDGFRVDAVCYLVEREGTDCADLPETHQFYKALRKVVDEYDERVLLAESVPSDINRLIPYFGDSDEFHMCLNFPFSASAFASAALESATPVATLLKKCPEIPQNTRWGNFLRNHDELHLQGQTMVSKEMEDKALKVLTRDKDDIFASRGLRTRINHLLDFNKEQWKLLTALLFSYPGSPTIYYGDELGMAGVPHLPDRYNCRTPMQWSSGKNGGFSSADKTYLPVDNDPKYGYKKLNVADQKSDQSSYLNFVKNITKAYKQQKAFTSKSANLVEQQNEAVLVFDRILGAKKVRCIFNFSKNKQPLQLDLSAYTTDILGSDLPQTKDEETTLPPYAHYWLSND